MTLTGIQIGNWVHRRSSSTKGKWHLVESVVVGDAITRCGKRMKDETGLQVAMTKPQIREIDPGRQICKAGCDNA